MFKSWIYLHNILPRVLEPVKLYDITMTTIIAVEKRISSYLRTWLGLPRGLGSIVLYEWTNTLKLSFRRQTEEYMITKTREAMMFQKSKDSNVATHGIKVRASRRWNASLELRIADKRLRHKTFFGTVAVGRISLGYCTNKDIRRATGEEYRNCIQN